MPDLPRLPRTASLRTHRPGDIGWMISRHGALYAQEYGFDGRLRRWWRASVPTSRTLRRAARSLLIAERDGVSVGCVALVQARDEKTGQPCPTPRSCACC